MSTSAIAHITTCTLCRQRFTAPPAVLIGESIDQKTARFLMAIGEHFDRRHPKESTAAGLEGRIYTMLLLLTHLVTEDENLTRMSELTRHRIHDRTTARRINDETIIAKVAALALPIGEEETARLTALIRDMRDILQEAGAFAPGGVPLAQPPAGPPPA